MRGPNVLLCIAITVIISCSELSGAKAQTFTRQSFQEFSKDQNKLISLLRGVLVMKRRNSAPKDSADYRRSWEYWAAIHGYVGEGSPSGTLEEYMQRLIDRNPDDAPLYAGFFGVLTNLTPPDQPPGLAEKIWATCEHGSAHFFTWHRMYLYFFERVLREASGDPTFALPYWDYTNDKADQAQPNELPYRLPTIFAMEQLNISTGLIANPLYEKRRTAGFGQLVQLDPRETDVDSTLALDDFNDFQSGLEGGVHGFVHCATGNGCLAPYMGLVPFSANDPLFWHHHANLDRLWDCWSKTHGVDANPKSDTAWMEKEYAFVDETGGEVSMKVSELFDPHGRIDYVYDNIENCTRIPLQPQIMSALPDAVVNSVAEEISRSDNNAVTRLNQSFALNPSVENIGQKLLFAVGPSVLGPTRVKLRLRDVRIQRKPGASVQVLLTDADGQNSAFVGVIGFFSTFEHAAHGDATHGKSYVFDVSRQMQDLAARGVDPTKLNVSLVATSGVTGEEASVDAERYASSGLTVGRIAIEVETSLSVLDLE